MTETTRCPACGAPLDYPGQAGTIRCDFCGTELSVSQEDGETRFQVLSKPEPQQETLTHKAEEQLEGLSSQAARVYGPDRSEKPGGTEGEPVAPGFTPFATAESDPGAISAALPEMPVTVDRVPEVSVHYQAGEERPSRPGTGNRNRWIGIGLAVFLVACILCACVAFAAFFFTNQRGF